MFILDPKERYRTGSGSCPVHGLCISVFEASVSGNRDLCYWSYWSCSLLRTCQLHTLDLLPTWFNAYVGYFGSGKIDLLPRILFASFVVLSTLRFVAT